MNCHSSTLIDQSKTHFLFEVFPSIIQRAPNILETYEIEDLRIVLFPSICLMI